MNSLVAGLEMIMSDRQDQGASQATGLSSPTEPCGLGPSGFDPSRIAALTERVRNMLATEDHPAMAEFWAEIAEAFESLVGEMARRDENERRNCINWGPCSRNDHGMSEADYAARKAGDPA